MLKNYLKIAWRNLRKQPFFTFLNTFGLAIGMAGGLLIGLYIYDELSFDRMFTDYEQIYRVDADINFGGKASNMAVAPAPLAATLINEYSQVEKVTRLRNLGSRLLRSPEKTLNIKESNSAFVDSTFFDLFGIQFLEGDAVNALKRPNTLVLTKTAAEKHFGQENAVGKSLMVDNEDVYTVTGIIDDLPKNSFLRDHSVFMAMAGNDDALNTKWGSHNYVTFVKLHDQVKPEVFESEIQKIVRTYVMDWAQAIFPGITHEQFLASGNYLNYELMPLSDIHLKSSKMAEMSPNSSSQNVYILFFIGLFLIILASVNFMNLSTAHSLKRAKEVGIRKTLGSEKSGLIRQFLTESVMVAMLSLLFGLILAIAFLPLFNNLASKSISVPYANPFFWLILLVSSLLLGLFSGSYPSFFLSRFSPVKVLKGTFSGLKGGSNIRNSLVVFQFTISVFLILSTVVVFRQLSFIQNKDVGFQKSQILIIDDLGSSYDKIQPFKERIEQLPQIEQIALSSYLPTPSSRSDNTFYEEGHPEQEENVNMQEWSVSYEYLSTMGMKLAAGRDFDRNMATDSSAMIINETTARLFGRSPEDAIGLRIVDPFGTTGVSQTFTVIGVVKNFHFESLRQNINALSMHLGNYSDKMIVKIQAGDFERTISQIEETWASVAPGQPFNYYFMDDSFNSTYQSEQRLGQIFMIFTFLSILIACLGLFGLAAFNAEKRIKEIGVRKVMGASVGQIVYKLSSDFLKLVFIAILVSLPLGWYAMNKWLEDFQYRIEIPWWVYTVAAFIAVAIALITVSYQAIKAAMVNPVKSLRSE